MKRMKVSQYKTGNLNNFTYLLAEPAGGEAAVVDPHEGVARIVGDIELAGLRARWILNTHSHWDHTLGNHDLKARTGASIVQHRTSPGPKDLAVADGDSIRLGKGSIRVLHTPGHTPDSVCFIAEGCIFTGDTLFIGECGRVDLPGSDPGAMYESLLVKLRSLPDDLEVYPGHDYGTVPHAPLGHEKVTNYTLKPRSREEFKGFILSP